MRWIFLAIVLVFSFGCSSNKKSSKEMTSKETSKMTKKMKKEATKAKAAKSSGNSKKITCVIQGEERHLEIKKTDSKGCELVYTKNGQSDAVATSSHNSKYCQEVSDRIRGKLESAGFDCK